MTSRPRERVPSRHAAAVLDILAAASGEPVSGEDLSRRLGVSRSAVWKRIELLRDAGFPILSLKSRGYILAGAEGLLIPSRIDALRRGKRVGSRIVYLAETGSTNADAVRLAEDGAPEGTVVIADSQTAGKGRLGRRWESPPGRNLYCSVILRPPIPPQQATHLTFLSSLAVSDAARDVAGVELTLKWPNDLMARGKKCAGLLNEMSAESDQVRYLVLGIGVNLNLSAADFPTDLRSLATSLSVESGQTIDRNLFAARLFDALDAWYERYWVEGFEPVRQEWTWRSWTIGKRVCVTDGGDVGGIVGRAVAIDGVGALLVETRGGWVERVLAGDVTVLEGGE
ncbi:MAG: biotin--[acetyl-CoA-carboxylase] ligase [Desulfuromonadia bacterium]